MTSTTVKMAPGKTLCATAAEAVADVFSGATIAVGGFGPVKNRPGMVLQALAERPDVTGLTIVSNGFPYQQLAEQRQVVKLIAAFGGSVYRRPQASEELIRNGDMEFEPSPQGIFTERLRAGAAGLPAFYSPVGVHTVVAEGKERRVFDGREYILETALRPDFAFVRAQIADEAGNLSGVGSTQNFHPVMAAAGRITVAEVDEIVPAGQIAPEAVTIPGIYVDRIVLRDPALDAAEEEQERARQQRRERPEDPDRVGLTPELMALRVANMLQPGQYVNLGMGIPTMVANFIQPEMGVTLHAENGFLGYGPRPTEDEYRWYHYNAQGQPVTVLPGASVFDSVHAFTMARGGHLDVVVLGGLQVSPRGDLANWWAPYMAAGGMGGAMDLCTDVPEVIVVMEHVTRDGDLKILNECEYPLTAKECVTRIVTDLAVIDVTPDGLVLREVAPGVTPEYVQERTEPPLRLAEDCQEMQLGR
jgi:3-oxoacid CoA-transferase